MVDKIRKIKYYRQSEYHNYLFALFNGLTETNVKDSIIYTRNEQYIVFVVYGNSLYFSNKYVWKSLIFGYSLKIKYSIDLVKEVIELLYPQYKNYEILYSENSNNVQSFVSKNKLNKLYLENNNYNKFRCYYVIDDFDIKHKYSKNFSSYRKGEFVYFNGSAWYKIVKNYKNLYINNYFPPSDMNMRLLDLNIKEDIRIFNWFKSHILKEKNGTNYYFQ